MADARELLVEGMRRHGLGGAVVAVVRRGEPPTLVCEGLADGSKQRPVDSGTVFRIASISKTMTAIGVMQLRDQGLLALDDPVNKYLRAFTVDPPSGGPEVTFRHLLTHTAGIGELPRVSDLVRRQAWGSGKPGAAAADLGALYRGRLRTEVPAGSKWAYANHGFAVLAQVVQDISGRPFAEHMLEQVFEPLGMTSTDYRRTERTADQLATGYHWLFGRLRPLKDYDLTVQGPGSVLSSVSDMASYAEWLLHGGAGAKGEVLRSETVAEMMSPQYSVDPRLPGMGLAFFLDHLGRHRVAGHDGNVPGFASALLIAPDEGIGVVVLTNTSSFIGAHLLALALLRSLLGVPDPAVQLPRIDVADHPHAWSELVGHYAPRPGFLTNFRAWQVFGGEVQVVIKHRQLVIRGLSGPRRLRQGLRLYATDDTDPLLFVVEFDGLVVPIAFERDATGRVETLAIGPPGGHGLPSPKHPSKLTPPLATRRRWRVGRRVPDPAADGAAAQRHEALTARLR